MAEGDVTLAKKVHIYSNGDRFFTGRRFVINPRRTRNYDSFLNQVTLSLQPAFGAVRVLRTPENGHPVGDLADLETGRSYVACAQKFVKLGYEDISTKPKPAPSPERRNKVIVSGRIRKIDRTPIAIFVYTNGEVLEPARRVLLKPWVQKTWETVLVAINEKINLRTGAIRHIVDFASKEEVTEGVHLKNNEYYVAVGSERYKDIEYGIQTAVLSPRQQQKKRYPALRPLKNKSGNTTGDSQGSSPLESSTNSTQSEDPKNKRKKVVQQPANNEEGIPIKPIKHKRGSSEKPKEPKEQPASAQDEPKKKPTDKKKQPQQAPQAAKNQPPRQTQPPLENQPAPTDRQNPPPAKKSNNKSTIDLDKDESGVFKSKGKKQKATEVKEANTVKEEVPIDKRKAEEVEEEEIESHQQKEPLPPAPKQKAVTDSSKKSPVKKQPAKSSSQPPAKSSSQPPVKEKTSPAKARKSSPNHQAYRGEQQKAAVTIQAGYRGYRTRKELKNKSTPTKSNKSGSDETKEKEKAAVKIQANYRGYKTRKALKKNKPEKNKEKEQELAAVKIQANYRGYKTRKALKKNKPEKNKEKEQELAAVKIQSSYRGYQTRKELKKSLLQNDKKKDDSKDEEKAAITIQAGYRGYKGRKQAKALKIQKTDTKSDKEARAQSSQAKSKG